MTPAAISRMLGAPLVAWSCVPRQTGRPEIAHARLDASTCPPGRPHRRGWLGAALTGLALTGIAG